MPRTDRERERDGSPRWLERVGRRRARVAVVQEIGSKKVNPPAWLKQVSQGSRPSSGRHEGARMSGLEAEGDATTHAATEFVEVLVLERIGHRTAAQFEVEMYREITGRPQEDIEILAEHQL